MLRFDLHFLSSITVSICLTRLSFTVFAHVLWDYNMLKWLFCCNYSVHRPKLNVHILWDYHFSQFVFVIHICSNKEGKPVSSLVSSNVRFDSPGKQMSKYLVGPFTVSKPTSPEDLKLIQYVFDSSLSESLDSFSPSYCLLSWMHLSSPVDLFCTCFC
jgi:hypothetical protein